MTSIKLSDQQYKNLYDLILHQSDLLRKDIINLKVVVDKTLLNYVKLADVPDDYDPNKTYTYVDFRAKVVEYCSNLWTWRSTHFKSNDPIR